MLLAILVAALAAALFYYVIVKPYDYWKSKGVKQGKPMWLLGDMWGTLFQKQNVIEMYKYNYNQVPGVRYSGMYQFTTPVLIVKDPDLLKQVTVKDFDHFTDHSTVVIDYTDPIWNKNLFALKGETWRDMRAILSPSFTSSKMKIIFGLMTECAEKFVQHFQRKKEDVIEVDLKDIFTRFANDVIASTAFGIEVDSLGEPDNQFYVMGRETTDYSKFSRVLRHFGFLLFPKLFALFKISLMNKEIGKFFLDVVNQTIKVREEQGIVRPDMIHLLMEAKKGNLKHEKSGGIDTGFATAQESEQTKSDTKPTQVITNSYITSQALAFFIAGFDSVSNLLTLAGYELGLHPEIQDRLRKEVRSTLEECGGKLTYEGLMRMKYMDMVISEALRKWPSIIATDRVCTKPYTIEPTKPGERPVQLQKGSLLQIPIYGIHWDPEYYPDPDRFDPERFSDENKRKINPYTYFPFGLGPRNCIGSRFALLEAKAMFFYLLLHFEIVPVEKSPIPLKLSKKSYNVTAEGGFWMGLKRIKE